MALPSQVERSVQMSRPIMTRSSKRRTTSGGKAFLFVIGAIGVLGAMYGIYRLVPRSADASPNIIAGDPPRAREPGAVKPAERKPAAPKPAAPKPAEPSPVTIRQGSGSHDAASPKPVPVDVTRNDLKPQPGPAGGGSNPPALLPDGPKGPVQMSPSGSTAEVGSLISTGDRLVGEGKLVDARVAYSRAYLNPQASAGDKASLRDKLTKINDDLVFSPKVTPGDPLAETYAVQAGDNLVKIAQKRELATDWRLIQRVNRISSPRNLSVGQKVKLLRGPFHVVISKSDFRADLFAGGPTEPERWLYIRSYPVGLGESSSETPLGEFVVKKHGKLANPPWVNPRTGEKFAADDPKNPIGEFWIGWRGVGSSETVTGFGLHGTIDPSSIGHSKSMGCVRMNADDIAQVYELLVEEVSHIRVVP